MSDLLVCCEDSLCSKLEDDTVFPLLVLADQFNTPRLRHSCFDYIASKSSLTTPENINQLTDELRREILSLNSWIRPEFNFDEHFDNLEKTVSRSSSPPAFDPFLDYNLLDQDPLLGAESSQAPFLDYSDNPFKDSFNPFAENSAFDPQGNKSEANNIGTCSSPKLSFDEVLIATKDEYAAKQPISEAGPALKLRNPPIDGALANDELRNPPIAVVGTSNTLEKHSIDGVAANGELRKLPMDINCPQLKLINPLTEGAHPSHEITNAAVPMVQLRNETEAADQLRNETEAADQLRNETEAADQLRNETEAADQLRYETEAADQLRNETEAVIN